MSFFEERNPHSKLLKNLGWFSRLGVAFGKRQREHPHKLSDLIVKERCETRPEPVPAPHVFARQTHNYTGVPGLNDSPKVPVSFDFRGLAEGHRSLSEQRIIATKVRGSTINFDYFHDCDNPRPGRPRGGGKLQAK